ncbi:MAG: DNA integrity scanning protein DisA nucleotide-binding domain protein [Magnetococcus sp. DMHC-6]
MFDPKMIKAIIEIWKPDTIDSQDQYLFDHVKNIMEMVFLAGLKRNEDRPVKVGVALVEPSALPDKGRSGESIVFRLGQRPLLTVDTLVKLAPAFDPNTTVLAVCASDQDSRVLEIWSAIFTTHRGRNRFDALPLEMSSPHNLTIISKKTGSLLIYHGDELIARFKSGEFLEPVHTHFTSGLIGRRFLDVIKQHPEFTRYGTEYWLTYRDFIDYLLMEADRRGHGGIIVWMPSESINSEEQCIIPKYTLTESPEGSVLIGDLCDMELKRRENRKEGCEKDSIATVRIVEEIILECKRKLIEHAELLAQLTCVDGALILSDRLRPLSFGSFLLAPIRLEQLVYWKDNKAQPFSRADLFSKYGTRHNAAVNFVGQCPDSAVFVISQDGPITGLTKKDESMIHWWPDCLGKY